MRILFLVQGEGRGHLTQAISLGQILRDAGHEIVAAMAGTSPGRAIPSFFSEQIQAPVLHFDAPNIVYNTKGCGMNLRKTLTTLFTNSPRYIKSLRMIRSSIQQISPDLIISFYETYSGIYNVVFGSRIPMVCIAHQYLLLHPKFVFPEKSRLNRFLINLNSSATSWLAVKRLALSFRRIPSRPDLNLTVVPPLLRREVVRLCPENENFFLVYMTHHSLSKQVIDWHSAHPEIILHCFWDKAGVPEELAMDETLTFHKINSEKYLRLLSKCQALVTTAGFESVCEAMYLGKPVMMVPVPNHFEQECNALDGVISGAGVTSKSFDLSVLLDYLPKHVDQSDKFKAWYHSGESLFIEEIEALQRRPEVKRPIFTDLFLFHQKAMPSLSAKRL